MKAESARDTTIHNEDTNGHK